MARKRAPGAGRKPRGPFSEKRATFTTRITKATRRDLEHAARKSGLSISQLAERLLRLSLQRPSSGGLHNRALGHVVAILAERIEEDTGAGWLSDPFTGLALIHAVEALLFHFAAVSDGTAPIPAAVEAVAKDMPRGDFAENYRKPAGCGQFRARHLILELEKSRPEKMEDFNEWGVPMFFDAPIDVLRQILRSLTENKKGKQQ